MGTSYRTIEQCFVRYICTLGIWPAKTDKSNRSQSPVQRPYRQWIPFPDRYLEHQYLRTGCNTFRTKLKAGQEPGSLCQPTFYHRWIRWYCMGDIQNQGRHMGTWRNIYQRRCPLRTHRKTHQCDSILRNHQRTLLYTVFRYRTREKRYLHLRPTA